MKKKASCFQLLAIFLTIFTSFLFGQDSTSTMTGNDGKIYKIIKIGNQVWMAENLRETKYRNGRKILQVSRASYWVNTKKGAYCVYNNNESNADTYGYLYNWYAINDSRCIAPEGWHVPTDEDWKELEMTLGMNKSQVDTIAWRGTNEGGKLKTSSTSHWRSPNTGATNESGFSALPGGHCWYTNGAFEFLGFIAAFWSSSESSSHHAWGRNLSFKRSDIYRPQFVKQVGLSVRLVKDN